MSLTPIFDATLADTPVNIWQASAIFPRPRGEETLQEALVRIGHLRAVSMVIAGDSWTVPPLQPAFTDWTAITRGASS